MPTPPRSRLLVAILLGAMLFVLGGSTMPPRPTVAVVAVTKTTTPRTAERVALVVPGGPHAVAAIAKLHADRLVVDVELVETGYVTGGGQTIRVVTTMSGSVSGRDVAVESSSMAAGRRSNHKVRIVGSRAYETVDGVWVRRKPASVRDQVDALYRAIRLVDHATQLRSVGKERIGRRDVVHLTGVAPIPYEPVPFGTAARFDTFDLWVREDGTPYRFEGTFSSIGPGLDRYRGTTTIQFLRYDGVIKIKAPKRRP
jgi:hypothetical protein